MPDAPTTPTPRNARPVPPSRGHRRWWWLAVPALIVLAVALGWQLVLQRLRTAVLQALGPTSQVQRVDIGLAGVVVEGLRVPGQRGRWPADDELRADRISVVPDWQSLWGAARGGPWQLHSVTVQGAYVALLRGADGRLQVLPSVLRPATPQIAAGAGPAAALPLAAVGIGQLRLDNAVVELYDATVRKPAHRLRLEALNAQAGPLAFPPAGQPTTVHIQGRLKGPRHDGSLALGGQLDLATRDATLDLRLQGVDLQALQPYLLKRGEGSIRGGRLDLQLTPTVRQQQLHAPGSLTLHQLDLADGDGLGGWLTGVSRQAVLGRLQRDGRISLQFSVDGRLDDPAFSINDSLARRFASGLAEAVGVSVSGVVGGVGGLVRGLLGR